MDFDQAKAEEMIGKIVLAGISHCDGNGNVLNHQQCFGTVLRVNPGEGLVIASGVNGEEITLPPSLEDYTPADPGTYTLKSIECVVVDPDYLATWRVYPQSLQK